MSLIFEDMWKLWFAWRPVTIDGERVWWAWTERHFIPTGDMTNPTGRYLLRKPATPPDRPWDQVFGSKGSSAFVLGFIAYFIAASTLVVVMAAKVLS